jgi:hypothetical protein
VADGNGGEATASVSVTVTAVVPENVAPVAVADTATVDEDASVLIDVLANDSDADGDSLTIESATTPANGTVDITDSQVLYTPSADFAGTDSFTYTVADGNGGEATASVSVTVTAAAAPSENNAPVVMAGLFSVEAGNVLLAQLVAGDADGDTLTFSLVSNGSLGTAVITDEATGAFSYTANEDVEGTDTFTFKVSDGQAESAVATVSVTVAESTSAELQVTLAWNANSESDLAGYKLYVGFSSGNYGTSIDVGDATQYTLGDLTEGETYFLALTAYNTSGLESDYSDEVTYTVTSASSVETTENTTEDDVEAVEPDVTTATTSRIMDGLQVLYTFNEGEGDVVYDVSGVGDALNLSIDDSTAVSWGAGVLSVEAGTLIASNGAATKVNEAVMASNEITIEAWVKSASLDQDGPARIVTVSLDAYERNTTLGQEGDYYQVRMRTTASTDNGKPYLTTDAGVVATDLTHLVYTRSADGQASVFINGVETASDSSAGDLSSWDASYSLALANELNGGRPWLGDYHLVAIYSRAFSAQDVISNYAAGADATADAEEVADTADTTDAESASDSIASEWSLLLQVDGLAALTVGISSTATDGWDADIDAAASATAELVSLSTDDVAELTCDMRSLQSIRQDWYLQVADGATRGVVITWDNASLPQDGTLIWSTLDDDGAIVAGSEIELSEVDQIQLTAGAEFYRLSFISTLETSETLQLVAGWNLVSFSLNGENDTPDSVFGTDSGMQVWTYDVATQTYQAPTQVQTGAGYWVFSSVALTIEHAGVPASVATVSLKAGWNLVGPVAAVPLPAGTTAYTWAPDTQQQSTVTSLLVPGKGYWLFAKEEQDAVLR